MATLIVKPLEWSLDDNGWWRAEGPGFVREILDWGKSDEEVAALKAEAQADFEACILAVVSVSPDAINALVVEALRDLADAARSACDARQHPKLTEALFGADVALSAFEQEGRS